MPWLDAFRSLFVVRPSKETIDSIRANGYASGYKEGLDVGYKKGYDATHETSDTAAQSLKKDAQTDLLYQMLEIVGQHYDGPITPGKVVDIIKGQGYVEGLKAGQVTPTPVEILSDSKLLTAVLALYTAAFWSPDRPVDAIALWTDVREAAGIASGTGPAPLTAEAIDSELNDIEGNPTIIEGVLDEEVTAVKGLQEEAEPWQQSPQATPSPLNSESFQDSSEHTSDSSSSSLSPLPSSSDTKNSSTTKKRSRGKQPRKPLSSSQRKKKPTHN
jgi:hypothetical protein